MLVLSRKEGERIVIGDNITLVISKVCGNRVTIGIDAPRDVKVVRSELQVDVSEALKSSLRLEEEAAVPTEDAPKQPVRSTLRDFAASVLPLQRQVG